MIWQIYVIREKGTNLYKIGKTYSIPKRIKQLQCGNPHKLELVAISDGNIESFVHSAIEKYHVRGEWYELDRKGLEKALKVMAKFSNARCVVEFNT
jgi:hypothetical protein